MTTDKARTKGVNPLMSSKTCPFLEFDDPESASISTISSMTTEEDGAGAIWPRCFSKYSSYSFFDLTDITL